MNIDEAGSDNQSTHVDDAGSGRVDARGDTRDHVTTYPDVCAKPGAARPVDNMRIREEQVVGGCLRGDESGAGKYHRDRDGGRALRTARPSCEASRCGGSESAHAHLPLEKTSLSPDVVHSRCGHWDSAM